MGLKMSEILLILAALLLLFGASRLPQLGTSLGSAIRNFKKGFGGDGDEPAKGASTDATATIPADQALAAGTRNYNNLVFRTVGTWTLSAHCTSSIAFMREVPNSCVTLTFWRASQSR